MSEEVYPIIPETHSINFAKNVYNDYDSSMLDFRSTPEKLFEKYCETLKSIKFIYKNGDKGINYISMVYQMALGRARSFYPDYLVQMSDGKQKVGKLSQVKIKILILRPSTSLMR